MWHWMRASVRVSHRGWKLATRVARLAIGVPDYEAHAACIRDERAAAAEPLNRRVGAFRAHAAPRRESERAGSPG